MKRFLNELSLSISKRTNLSLGEINVMFNECNIKRILGLQAELMDGSIHNFKVDEFFTKQWEVQEGEEE